MKDKIEYKTSDIQPGTVECAGKTCCTVPIRPTPDAIFINIIFSASHMRRITQFCHPPPLAALVLENK